LVYYIVSDPEGAAAAAEEFATELGMEARRELEDDLGL
jgi:hypothetical protein